MQEAIQNSEEEIDMVGPQLLHEEIVEAPEAMKLGKTERVDGILVEMINVRVKRQHKIRCKCANKCTHLVNGQLISCNVSWCRY